MACWQPTHRRMRKNKMMITTGSWVEYSQQCMALGL